MVAPHLDAGFVYALSDADGLVRYVGATTRNPRDRYRQVVGGFAGGHVGRWAKYERAAGRPIRLLTLEACERSWEKPGELADREHFWIHALLDRHFPLLNLATWKWHNPTNNPSPWTV